MIDCLKAYDVFVASGAGMTSSVIDVLAQSTDLPSVQARG